MKNRMLLGKHFPCMIKVMMLFCIITLVVTPSRASDYPDGDYGKWGNLHFYKNGSVLTILLNENWDNEGNVIETSNVEGAKLHTPNYDGTYNPSFDYVWFNKGLCSFVEKLGIETIILGEGFTVISSRFFRNCNSVLSISLPSSLQAIRDYAFADCHSLTSLNISPNVQEIGNYAFQNCIGLKKIVLPEGVQKVGDYAFAGCTNIEEVTIQCNLTSITNSGSGYHHFQDCANIEKIKLLSNKTGIGNFPPFSKLFQWALPSIKEVDFLSGSNCIIWSDQQNEAEYIPLLYHVTIPEGVETISGCSFRGCPLLKQIILPSTLKTLGNRVFYNSGLTHIILPEGLTKIEYGAFTGCESLKYISIPSSLTFIGYDVFTGCNSLDNINSKSIQAPTLQERVFNNVGDKKNITLIIPEGANSYYTADIWKEFQIQTYKERQNTTLDMYGTYSETNGNSATIAAPIIEGSTEDVIRATSRETGHTITYRYFSTNNNNSIRQKIVTEDTKTAETDGWLCTLSDLEPNTIYDYSVSMYDIDENLLEEFTGSFTTGETEGIEEISSSMHNGTQKIVVDGQILILRGDKTYTLTGQEVK